jgi:MarR family transcriptional regulator, 2-MHQ and catechol-resistance regulon repressor
VKPNTEKKVLSYVRLVRSAEALHQSVSRGLMIDGLTASQFSTLKVLRLHGALAQRDIAKYILKSGGNITIVVDNLERVGLVVRDRDTEDRRIVYVSLTPAGIELFDRVYPDHLQRIRESMGALTEAECDQLVALLDKLAPPAEEIVCTTSDASALAETV